MPSFSPNLKRKRGIIRSKFKVMGNHDEFITRIKKTLYYGKLPLTERFSLPVTELAAELFSEVKYKQSLDRLHLEEAAAMSRNACVSPCSLVLALLYLERLKACNPTYLHEVSSSDLFLVSLLVASKFLHDDGEEDEVFNDEWATSAGVDVKGLNCLEKDFLNAINWEVFVSEQAFWRRLYGLERDVALRGGLQRGWFSYTDMDHLLDTVDLFAVAGTLITVSAVCLTSYTATVLTMVGSALIASHAPLHPSLPTTTSHLPPFCTLRLQDSASGRHLDTDFILSSIDSRGNDSEVAQTVATCWNPNSHTVSQWVSNFLGINLSQAQLIMDIFTFLQAVDVSDCLNKGSQETKFVRKLYGDHTVSNMDDIVEKSEDVIWEVHDVGRMQEWASLATSWIKLTSMERSLQTKFLPLEVTAY